MSETSKYRALTTPYCTGNGIDIASGGDPVVPHAISIELDASTYAHYNSNQPPRGPLHYRDNNAIWNLPFKDGTLDFVYCSHLLEDFTRDKWPVLLREWSRVLKPGGHLVILVPEVTRWNYAIRVLGQNPNCSHCAPEPSVGELSYFALTIGMLDVVEERLTECHEHDYTILAAFRRRS